MEIQDKVQAQNFVFNSSLVAYERFKTRVVNIGDLPLGGDYPIRVQSMTTTPTLDTFNTVAQSIRMIEAGSEYIRITAPSLKEAENLEVIKREIRNRGYHTPIIADIHFTPNAAEMAARLVEKVRINPGNYADKKKFDHFEYTPSEYQAELDRIRIRFKPLIKICKEYGTAMRIGTNHGSLSDRIMSYYGDSPKGMVESAMEFIQFCEEENFYDLVISMKASNPKVMVQAYRLLVHTMMEKGMNYPLHLGVTEAGDGEDGRIKSAIGIGALLEDGLGDTIRVSLTEDPEAEIPVARNLVDRYKKERIVENSNKPEFSKVPKSSLTMNAMDGMDGINSVNTKVAIAGTEEMNSRNAINGGSVPSSTLYPISPFDYNRHKTHIVGLIGGNKVPKVIMDIQDQNLRDPGILEKLGYRYHSILDKYTMQDVAADLAYVGDNLPSFEPPGHLEFIVNYQTWKNCKDQKRFHPLIIKNYYAEFLKEGDGNKEIKHFVLCEWDHLDTKFLENIKNSCGAILILEDKDSMTENHSLFRNFRQIYFHFLRENIKAPVIFRRNRSHSDMSLIEASRDFGGLLLDGFGDGLWIDNLSLSFGILQATRTRISKTEYISCPSCGRTLFDLQEVTQMIRSMTGHLKGVKIGIMGCIVNGPGEMADADYGYVGSGPGKITLYRGKEVVKKNVEADKAVNELIQIIEEDGRWVRLEVEI